MAGWGASNYGDPCRECGFDWAMTIDGGMALVSNLPDSISELVAGSTGKERHPQLAWSVEPYVGHIADNLRIWAERLVGVREGGVTDVHGYDENELAHVRRYEGIPLGAAQWSLGRAVDDWYDTVTRSSRSLWTFQSNHRARRFYERHGFEAIGMTAGDNEEGAPDVHYQWHGPAIS